MDAQVTNYRLIWEPKGKRGEVAFFINNTQGPIKIPVASPEEFSAITAIFRTFPVYWNGSYFTTGQGFAPQIADNNQFATFTFEEDIKK